ncbi:YybH family protein [Mycobacterium sp. 48b]|uniref:YybH family protein n=1 Tax=Mycobacterium sp. 48b TaxID=3400426 RepID=UPI003AAC74D0
MTEAAIRQRIADGVDAIRARDLDALTALYAPDVVSFDLGAPLRYAGDDNKRRAWQEVFAAYTGPIGYDVHELTITTEGDIAFVHSLNHVRGTLASGRDIDMWLRWTACLRRVDGVWMVTHDHVSVPADLEYGKAIVNLTP